MVPLAAIVILVTILATRGYRSVLSSGSYDVVGLLIGGASITLITYGLQNSSRGWNLVDTWSTLLAVVLLLRYLCG